MTSKQLFDESRADIARVARAHRGGVVTVQIPDKNIRVEMPVRVFRNNYFDIMRRFAYLPQNEQTEEALKELIVAAQRGELVHDRGEGYLNELFNVQLF